MRRTIVTSLSNFYWETIEKLFIKVRALLGHKIGYTVLAAADSIVISSFLGLKQLAIYSNYYQIINSLIGFVM